MDYYQLQLLSESVERNLVKIHARVDLLQKLIEAEIDKTKTADGMLMSIIPILRILLNKAGFEPDNIDRMINEALSKPDVP